MIPRGDQNESRFRVSLCHFIQLDAADREMRPSRHSKFQLKPETAVNLRLSFGHRALSIIFPASRKFCGFRHVARARRFFAAAVSLASRAFCLTQTPVMAVTDPIRHMSDTPIVNMVRRACKKVLFEPGDTRQQWKGEAAATSFSAGITSSRVLPTSSAGYWSPILSCVISSFYKRPRGDVILRG